jgi:glycosyltransferase involved in cell wall biosynthesis
VHYNGPLRVAIDARQLWELGIGTYVRNLIGGLVRTGGAELELTLLLPPRPWRDAWWDPVAQAAGIPGAVADPDREGPPPAGPTRPRVQVIEVGARKQSIGEQISVPLRLLGRPVDLVHAPHYVAPLGVSQPLVITVHDVIHLLFPEFLSPARRRIAGLLLVLALRRAQRVIVPSERTADDLTQLFPFARRKLRVTGSGLAARFATGPPAPAVIEAWRTARGLPRRYGLAVGAIRPHKNLVHLARAFVASGLAPEVQLLVAGEAPPRFQALAAEIAAAGPGIELLGRVPEGDLPYLYAGADFVAVPSLYEGFGQAAVEAMAMGVPVVASTTGSLPEIVGDAALLQPPDDLAAWSAALKRIGRDAGLRAELGARGRARAERHRLERLGAATLAVYREL